jgi:hypothetical protein
MSEKLHPRDASLVLPYEQGRSGDLRQIMNAAASLEKPHSIHALLDGAGQNFHSHPAPLQTALCGLSARGLTAREDRDTIVAVASQAFYLVTTSWEPPATLQKIVQDIPAENRSAFFNTFMNYAACPSIPFSSEMHSHASQRIVLETVAQAGGVITVVPPKAHIEKLIQNEDWERLALLQRHAKPGLI